MHLRFEVSAQKWAPSYQSWWEQNNGILRFVKVKTIYLPDSFRRKYYEMFKQNETSKSEKFKTSPIKRNETMESPSLHSTWTSDGRGPLVTHSSLSLNRYLLQPLTFMYPCNTADIHVHSSEKLPQPGKESATKKERLGCSHVFAGPLLSAWVHQGVPVGPSPPAIILASLWDCQRTSTEREWGSQLGVCSLLMSAEACFTLFFPLLENNEKPKIFAFRSSTPAAKIIFLCAFWARRGVPN